MKILPELTRKHPDTLLVVVGNGERNYVQHVRQLVRLNLEHQVLFTGMVTGQAKWGAFACAEVFVLPSRQENFAISMAEAMHMAVPVIISNKVNSWPFVETANAGFVVEEDQIELVFARRLDELLQRSRRGSTPGEAWPRFCPRALYLAKSGSRYGVSLSWDTVRIEVLWFHRLNDVVDALSWHASRRCPERLPEVHVSPGQRR